MGRSAPHLSFFLSRRICATHAFLRVVPSRCEWLHGGHPSRPLHAQHRVASGREEETRWSRDETGCTDHESMISERPTTTFFFGRARDFRPDDPEVEVKVAGFLSQQKF